MKLEGDEHLGPGRLDRELEESVARSMPSQMTEETFTNEIQQQSPADLF